MSLFELIGIAVLLLVIISVASELLAIGSEILEHKFGAGFVGSVILGFITMLPELIFVLVAIYADEPEVAVGSAVGGNILLFTLGYGMVILIAYFKHKEFISLPANMRDDLWYLVIAAAYLFIASWDHQFTLLDGIVLTSMYIVFVVHQFIETKRLQSEEDEHKEEVTRRKWIKSGSFMLIGTIVVLLAAEPFVEKIIEISEEMMISAVILALIISPIASEMPEKISAFVLAKKSLKGAEIAIANFVGSKVQGGTLLFGGMILLHILLPNGHETLEIVGISNIFLAVFTTVVGVAITYDLKLHWKEGVLVGILYVVSIAIAIMTGSVGPAH